MTQMTQVKVSYDDGREDQFREMMAELAALQAKYKGVRGELLAKVHDALEKLEPVPTRISASAAKAASTLPPGMLPSCRQCGRNMKQTDVPGHLVCERGHTRIL